MPKALIVIDMLNDYLHPNGLAKSLDCLSIVDNIKQCIDYAQANGIKVVYINTSLSNENSPLAKKWGMHAVDKSWGADVIDELKPKADDIIVKKQGYDGFFNTKLDSELKKLNIDTIYLTGIHTHVCVMATAIGGFQLGYNVISLQDCITTGFKENHDSRLRFLQTHTGSLQTMQDFINLKD